MRLKPMLHGVAAATAMALLGAACASVPTSDPGATSATPAAEAAARTAGDTSSLLVPVGFGTLRQDDISVRIDLEGVQLKASPLDESIIRLLSPDSYRTFRGFQELKRAEITALAQRAGIQQYRVWLVQYFGIAPEARFSPQEFVLTNNGREFRPIDVIPITSGFGENRLRQREVQSALYVFDGALDANQPVTVRAEGMTDVNSWSGILRRIERERAFVRSRASAGPAR